MAGSVGRKPIGPPLLKRWLFRCTMNYRPCCFLPSISIMAATVTMIFVMRQQALTLAGGSGRLVLNISPEAIRTAERARLQFAVSLLLKETRHGPASEFAEAGALPRFGQSIEGFQLCKNEAVDVRCAQGAEVRGRSCERVMSAPLLPFPIRPESDGCAIAHKATSTRPLRSFCSIGVPYTFENSSRVRAMRHFDLLQRKVGPDSPRRNDRRPSEDGPPEAFLRHCFQD